MVADPHRIRPIYCIVLNKWYWVTGPLQFLLISGRSLRLPARWVRMACACTYLAHVRSLGEHSMQSRVGRPRAVNIARRRRFVSPFVKQPAVFDFVGKFNSQNLDCNWYNLRIIAFPRYPQRENRRRKFANLEFKISQDWKIMDWEIFYMIIFLSTRIWINWIILIFNCSNNDPVCSENIF